MASTTGVAESKLSSMCCTNSVGANVSGKDNPSSDVVHLFAMCSSGLFGSGSACGGVAGSGGIGCQWQHRASR